MAALVSLFACMAPPQAQAGVYTDDFSKCLVSSASSDDQKKLMTWVFLALTAHPAIREELPGVTEARRSASTKTAAELMQRLMVVDCRKQMVAALKYEGSGAVEAAFRVLGEVATRGLMSDPTVGKSLSELQNYVDTKPFEDIGREAGVLRAK
jgi:hypothetical protein